MKRHNTVLFPAQSAALCAALCATLLAALLAGGGGNWHLKGDTTVTYDANGATSGSPPAAQNVISGRCIVVPNNRGLEKEGCTFADWNTRADGEGTGYASGDYLTVIDDITLYARWIPAAPDARDVSSKNLTRGGLAFTPGCGNIVEE
jgi:hypothetical protein